MNTPVRRRSAWVAAMVRVLVPLYLLAIVGAPASAIATLLAAAPSLAWRIGATILTAPTFVVIYVVVAGGLARLTRRAIVSGKFPRDLGHHVYGPRRLYALCWTSIYYCAPIYHAVLAVPALKWLTFRLFGYRGSLEFQTYPDTWIRDLPLLSFGKGAYLSNKATISPNMCLRNGKIIVLPVSIGAGTLIGHLSMIAPGVEIGEDSEVGVGVAVGVNARIGRRTLVDHRATLEHECVVGDHCVIGNSAYIGRNAVVHHGVRVPPCTIVPARSVLATQDDCDALAALTPRFAVPAGSPTLSLEA